MSNLTLGDIFSPTKKVCGAVLRYLGRNFFNIINTGLLLLLVLMVSGLYNFIPANLEILAQYLVRILGTSI